MLAMLWFGIAFVLLMLVLVKVFRPLTLEWQGDMPVAKKNTEVTPRTGQPVFVQGGPGTWDAVVGANYRAAQWALDNGDGALYGAYLLEQQVLVRIRALAE